MSGRTREIIPYLSKKYHGYQFSYLRYLLYHGCYFSYMMCYSCLLVDLESYT